jgi:hypothetical protein
MRFASAAAGTVLGVAGIPLARSFVVILAPLWVLAAGTELLRSRQAPAGRTTDGTCSTPLRGALCAAAGGCVGAFLGGIAAGAVLGGADPAQAAGGLGAVPAIVGDASPLRLVAASATWGCAVAAGMESGLRGESALAVFAGCASLTTAAGVGLALALPGLHGMVTLLPAAVLICGVAAARAGWSPPGPAGPARIAQLRAASPGLSSVALGALGGAIAIAMTGAAAALGASASPDRMLALGMSALLAAVVAAGAYALR